MNSISSTTPQIYNNTNISNNTNNVQNVEQKAEHAPENIGDSVSINSSSSSTKELTRSQIQAQTRAEETPPEVVARPEESTEEVSAEDTPSRTETVGNETEVVHEEETNTENNQKPKLKEKLADLGDKALEVYFSINDSIESFPAFIYPAVTGATAEQAEFTYKVLDKLPMKDVTSVSNIEWVPELFMSTDKTAHASGMAYSALSPYIQIAEDQCGDLGQWAEKVIIHETGHTRDYSEGILSNFGRETDTNPIWGAGNRITEYAKTNQREDFAESYQYFHTDGDKLKEVAPEKYDRIQEMEQAEGLEKVVEQDAFRETGKYIGEKLSKYPYLKTGLETASYVITGVSTVVDGVRLAHGIKENDEAKQMSGNLGLTATVASFANPIAGVAIDGAERALSRAIDKGQIKPEEANYVASHTVGAPIAGAIKLGKWVDSKISEIKANKAESHQTEETEETSPNVSDPEVNENEETSETPEKTKATFKSSIKALGIGIGGAVGSAAGAIGGIYAGVTAGFAIGGPAGGAVGFLIGAVLGNTTMNHLGAKIGSVIGGKIQNKVNPQPVEQQQITESSNAEEVNTQE